jgi:exonuclease III
LISNISEFKLFLKAENPKLLLLSETRQTAEINDALLHIDGYYILRCDAINRRTGGCIIYARNDIACDEVLNYNKNMTWFLTINVKKGLTKGTYGVLYKSPQENNENFLNYFEEFCEKLMTLRNKVMIFGDFNINFMNNSNDKNELNNIACAFKLKQIVNEVTRETLNSGTMIDLIFTNIDNSECKVMNDKNISDHNFIEAYINMPKESDIKTVKFKEITCWSKYRKEKLANDLFNVD